MSTLPEPVASQRQSAASRNQSEPPLDAVVTPITRQDSTKTTAHYLARRLQVVLKDLGLLAHIPSDWLQPGPEGLHFRHLSVREADRLVLAIEDLAQRPPPSRRSVSPDQLRLF